MITKFNHVAIVVPDLDAAKKKYKEVLGANVSEIFDLNLEHQQKYFEECNFLLKGMSELYLSNKMNIATLGNIVPQLHTHIIVRFTHDDAWPSPVWSHSENNQYNPEEAKLQIDKIGKLLDHYV